MNSGRLDEELGRMSQIIDHLGQNSMVLSVSSSAPNDFVIQIQPKACQLRGMGYHLIGAPAALHFFFMDKFLWQRIRGSLEAAF